MFLENQTRNNNIKHVCMCNNCLLKIINFKDRSRNLISNKFLRISKKYLSMYSILLHENKYSHFLQKYQFLEKVFIKVSNLLLENISNFT